MTFGEFCVAHNLTAEEREKVAEYLWFLRIKPCLRLIAKLKP